MSTLFAPFFQQVDSNGAPLSGAKLYFYQTGTSTLLDTYTSSALTTPNANPVVADANGRWGPIYLGTSSDYKVILKDSSDVAIATEDPIFASGTSGRVVVEDVAYTASVSDRLIAYTTLTAARTVALPSAASFAAGTMLYVVDESGNATASVTLSVSPSGSDTISGIDGSAHNAATVLVASPYGTGSVESDGVSKWIVTRRTLEGFATLASASTVNIGACAAGYINITGTTTITAFDSVKAGTERTLKFAGALTLTYNATSLILPTAASITTAAGDVAVFRSEGSGNWRCVDYQRASGAPLATFQTYAQAYVTVSGGVATIQKQTGFTSVTETATGAFTCTLSTAMPDTNYVVEVMCASGSGNRYCGEDSTVARTTTVFHLYVGADSAGANDPTALNIRVYA
jgi:hypothetical protein